MRRRPQGGLHQVKDQPQEGQEACCQEVVLHSLQGVWPCLIYYLANKRIFALKQGNKILVLESLLGTKINLLVALLSPLILYHFAIS